MRHEATGYVGTKLDGNSLELGTDRGQCWLGSVLFVCGTLTLNIGASNGPSGD